MTELNVSPSLAALRAAVATFVDSNAFSGNFGSGEDFEDALTDFVSDLVIGLSLANQAQIYHENSDVLQSYFPDLPTPPTKDSRQTYQVVTVQTIDATFLDVIIRIESWIQYGEEDTEVVPLFGVLAAIEALLLDTAVGLLKEITVRIPKR